MFMKRLPDRAGASLCYCTARVTRSTSDGNLPGNRIKFTITGRGATLLGAGTVVESLGRVAAVGGGGHGGKGAVSGMKAALLIDGAEDHNDYASVGFG